MEQPNGSTVKVIGFKIEGESSHSTDITSSTGLTIKTGSPLPVSIPPPFKTPRGQHIQNKFQESQNRSEASLESGTETETFQKTIFSDKHQNQIMRTVTEDSSQKSKKPNKTSDSKKQASNENREKKTSVKKSEGKGKREKSESTTQIPSSKSRFDHLDPFKPFDLAEALRKPEASKLHPTFVQFCLDYAENRIQESTACKAMLESLIQAMQLFHNEASLFYTRDFLAFLNSHIGFLVSCRSLDVILRNSIRMLKVAVTQLKSEVPLDEGKGAVQRILKTFVEERVDVLDIVAKESKALISENDVILTFGASETVLAVLSHAWSERKRFRVIVVDARPECSGKAFLNQLSKLGIPCTYILIHALGYALKGVSKVMMGASAVLSNGAVISRTGSTTVAMMAHAARIPTVICCQTLKFHERVQLDAFTRNELGDSKALLPNGSDLDTQSPFLSLLNLKYDLMPAAFVSVIVNELGFISADSVRVNLHEQSNDGEISYV